jgi:adenylate cyclase
MFRSAEKLASIAAQVGVSRPTRFPVVRAFQLIDGETETHLWAERYDRKLEDIFAIQDEITASIASTLFGRVEAARHDRVKRKTTANMAAYE